MPTVDAHQHFWEIDSGLYDWPTAADGPIYRTFTPSDLAAELTSVAIDRTVVVQTVDTLADTDSMLAAAAAHSFIAGVVGWVPLTDPATTEAALYARRDGALCGVRHLIHREPDPAWLARPDIRPGLALLAALGMPFDVVAVFPDHLDIVPDVADAHPDLTLVLDHLAKPPFRAPGWDTWLAQVRRAAERPNVVAKLSGLDTAAGPGWTTDEIRPAVDAVLRWFGPERLLFGSDWPVCRSVSTYAEVVSSMGELTNALSPTERAWIMGDTATRVYGLDRASRAGDV